MNILNAFFTDDLAMDLGTVNTLIYVHGIGIVLSEPSVVAVHKYTGEVLAVGREAHKLLGREPQDTEVHRPMGGGTISNFEIAEKMLAAFINRAHGGHKRRSHLVVGVPGSATTLEQHSVRHAARNAKASHVNLVDEGLCAAFGAGISFEDEHAHLVIDIGGGTTNITIVASGAVISSASIQSAGISMDEAIRDYVRINHAMQIGELTAEEIKKTLGAARQSDAQVEGVLQSTEVVGKELADGLAKSVEISSIEVYQALEPVIAEIIVGVRRVIEVSQPEVTADIYRNGIVLTGGGALLRGIAERLEEDLRLRVTVAENSLAAVALGAGRLLDERERLARVSIAEDVPIWQASEALAVNW